MHSSLRKPVETKYNCSCHQSWFNNDSFTQGADSSVYSGQTLKISHSKEDQSQTQLSFQVVLKQKVSNSSNFKWSFWMLFFLLITVNVAELALLTSGLTAWKRVGPGVTFRSQFTKWTVPPCGRWCWSFYYKKKKVWNAWSRSGRDV